MRYDVVFRGRVQGVGFRATARHIASRHPGVAGYVRNEPDGSVFIAVEGDSPHLDRFLADLRATMSNYISSEQMIEASPAGMLGFEIRR